MSDFPPTEYRILTRYRNIEGYDPETREWYPIKDGPWSDWYVYTTNRNPRGLYVNLGAVRGVLTGARRRESRRQEYQYRIQSRPVDPLWTDLVDV